jgi:hypothetical protein
MWKKLVILAVLLAVTQTPVPVPGQTPNHGNQLANNPKKETNDE